jgi:DNA-directed RNA polymerase III subunit RPC3
MSQVQLRLIKFILQDHFGDVAERVASTLAIRGPLPLPVLVQWTKLSGKQVRESLFVLIHHNLVQYRQADEEINTFRPVIYRLDIDAVLLRLAHPLFISLCERRYDTEGVTLLLEVIKHGRLLIGDTLGSKVLEKMIFHEFLENVAFEHSIWNAVNENVVGVSFTQSPNKKRIIPLPSSSPSSSSSSPPQKKIKTEDRQALKGGFVRIKTSTFIRAIWHEMLVDVAERRINVAGANVMRAALSCIGATGGNATTTFSTLQVSANLPPDTALPVDNTSGPSGKSSLVQYLEYLTQELDFVDRLDSQKTGGTYSVDLVASLTHLRMNLIEAFISSRFGQASTRIFRLLRNRKMLEEKTISKVAMMTSKEVRERLYELLRFGLVQLQEVPKTADHAPSRTFFLWTIPVPTLYRHLAEMSMRMLTNLLERSAMEKEKNEMLILKSERSDVVVNPSLLNETERRQLRNLRRVLDRLSFQIMRISKELLTLEFFK